MFYLEKCENCDRSGSVALNQGDTLCNLCSATPKQKSKPKPKDEEEDQEYKE